MADLDDFFAKKDRKKSKAVKKFATADELAKKLDDPKQKSDVRPKKERPVQEGEEGGRKGVSSDTKHLNFNTTSCQSLCPSDSWYFLTISDPLFISR